MTNKWHTAGPSIGPHPNNEPLALRCLEDSLIGQLPKCKGRVQYALVVVEYFTKWEEAAPLAKIITKKIHDFVYICIIYRFNILARLISDNGLQFVATKLASLCKDYGIQRHLVAVNHAPDNGQVETVNKILKTELKAHIKDALRNGRMNS